jgi:hypothetical protein
MIVTDSMSTKKVTETSKTFAYQVSHNYLLLFYFKDCI